MAVELKIPEVGESVTEVHIGEWFKAEGEYVEQDEPVVELESDKANMDLPAPVAGVLSKITKQTGEACAVGDVIGAIDEDAKPPAHESKRSKQEQGDQHEEDARASKAKPVAEEQRHDARNREPESMDRKNEKKVRREGVFEEQRVMPAARRILDEHAIDAKEVEATGPGGRLLKEDVQLYLDSRGDDGPSQAETTAARDRHDRSEEVVPMSTLRKRVAERLVEAQRSMAMLTTFNEIDLSAVLALRAKHQKVFEEKYGTKLGFMSFFAKAAVDALKAIPQLNAEIRGSDIIYKNYFDFGVAVSTQRGLVVPVLRNVERMSFAEVELAIADLATRAREKKLTPEDLTGGTFTISNGGVFGSLLSTPILNPPQSGILGLHAVQDRPVVRDGEIVIRPMMYVALTYDHRIVDGREAVTFLRRITECIESPSRMLVEV